MATALVAVALLGACTDDDPDPAATTTTTTAPAGSDTTTVPDDPALTELLITADDLPEGFAPQADVNDTITTFCAGQDAAAGLQASGRAIVGFTRTPAGASVIELAFRFDADGAARFVEQAEGLLTSCSDVPDATGLAFTYEPVRPSVAAAVEGVDAAATRYGVSVGSGNLTVDIAVLQHDDIAILVAVLGLDEPRESLDALAEEAFGAAVRRLQ